MTTNEAVAAAIVAVVVIAFTAAVLANVLTSPLLPAVGRTDATAPPPIQLTPTYHRGDAR